MKTSRLQSECIKLELSGNKRKLKSRQRPSANLRRVHPWCYDGWKCGKGGSVVCHDLNVASHLESDPRSMTRVSKVGLTSKHMRYCLCSSQELCTSKHLM